MTLQVPFEDLAAAAKRYGISHLYLSGADGSMLITGSSPEGSLVVASRTVQTEGQVRKSLESTGCELLRGVWSESPIAIENTEDLFVAAVGYQSGEHTPGVWMDAYTEEPTHVQVIENLYKEFRQTGELSEMTVEEFIRAANPNVVVTSRTQLKGFIAQRDQAGDIH